MERSKLHNQMLRPTVNPDTKKAQTERLLKRERAEQLKQVLSLTDEELENDRKLSFFSPISIKEQRKTANDVNGTGSRLIQA